MENKVEGYLKNKDHAITFFILYDGRILINYYTGLLFILSSV